MERLTEDMSQTNLDATLEYYVSTGSLALPRAVLDMTRLVRLTFTDCQQIESLPCAIAKLVHLRFLYASQTSLQAVPDLRPLVKLEELTLPRPLMRTVDGRTQYSAKCWIKTRELVMSLYQRHYQGGCRAAIVCFLLFCRQFNIYRDVANIIAREIFATRRDAKLWKRADRKAFDLANYHCEWPPAFVSCRGPSTLACHCGYSFVDPILDFNVANPNHVRSAQILRAEHFAKVFGANQKGACTPTSAHYPLHRSVQKTLARIEFRNLKKCTPEMLKQVFKTLQRRLGGPHMLVDLQYASAAQLNNRNLNTRFWSYIVSDVKICIAAYLELRSRGYKEPRGTQWNGLFSFRMQCEIDGSDLFG